jgi:hypothetical protein
VCALALGIAVNNSVFTLINTALIRELPFEDPDRLITVRTVNRKSGAAGGLSYAEFVDLSGAARTSFAAVAASVQATMSIGDPG